MTAVVPRGSTAVMARRVEPPDSLDFFPTPPWATRALFRHVLPKMNYRGSSGWEPACGEGHMAEVLREFFGRVEATDIFDYGYGEGGIDFLGWKPPFSPADWIITNPPFKAAISFTLRALELAEVGVAMLARTQWLESKSRYELLFKSRPPTIFAPFVERVPMVKGRWDPDASTATSHAWFVWTKNPHVCTKMVLIRPCRLHLTDPRDRERFAYREPTPLLA